MALIVCSLAFVAVFTYLAANFGYPEVLDRSAAEVLPLLAAGGRPLRNVWFLYAVLPLGIIFAGVVSAAVLERGGRRLRAVGMAAAVVAGVAMMLGLVRWPTIMWALARHWETSSAATQSALAPVFDAANLFLGNLIGELVGEIGLATWFVALGMAFRRDGRRLLGGLGIGAGFLVAVAALRNMTGAVAMVAEVNNVTLPLWLLTLGVVFVRDRRATMPPSTATTLAPATTGAA